MSKIETFILLLILLFSQKQNINFKNFSIPTSSTSSFSSTLFLNDLSIENIIYFTNQARHQYNLPPLKMNELLNKSAELKLNDMFQYQYFDHLSPQGKNIEYFVSQAGYQFLTVGENLALGDFKSSKEVVEKWLQSEGHRKNILSSKFQEIGVALGKGLWRGKEIILVVQYFGVPQNVCPQVDKELKKKIDDNKKQIENLDQALKNKMNEILATTEFYKINSLINEYNQIVTVYNNLVTETKNLIQTYNKIIEDYNACLNQFKD